jgi:hypothetical protein
LLRGEELTAWLASQPQFAPEPTLLHYEFIKAADDAEVARTSAERQRLDQMASAQADREKEHCTEDNVPLPLLPDRRPILTHYKARKGGYGI